MTNPTLPLLHYHAYTGHIEFNEKLGCYFGTVDNCPDTIICRGYSLASVERAFGLCIDVYVELCQRKGIAPKWRGNSQ